MTDDLIKQVAERLGWTNVKSSAQYPEEFYGDPPNQAEGQRWMLPHWLTSVDAALGVLDKPYAEISITRYAFSSTGRNGWFVNYQIKGYDHRGYDESLPRAILLAFLEAPHD